MNIKIKEYKMINKTTMYQFRYIIWFVLNNNDVVFRATYKSDKPLEIDFNKVYEVKTHTTNQNNLVIEKIEEV